MLLKIEKVVCSRHNLDIEQYYKAVQKQETEGNAYPTALLLFSEVLKRLKQSENVVMMVMRGEKPKAEFPVLPELTKELTLRLYQSILTSHLYLHYTKIQAAKESNPNLRINDLTDMIPRYEPEKIKRRYSRVLTIGMKCCDDTMFPTSRAKTTASRCRRPYTRTQPGMLTSIPIWPLCSKSTRLCSNGFIGSNPSLSSSKTPWT